MGEKRDDYLRSLKENIDKWNAEIDELEAMADQAKADALVQYRDQIVELKLKRKALEEKTEELLKAWDAAWKDVKSGVKKAKKTIGESMKSAKSRFN